MSGAESSYVNPLYSAGKLPTLPTSGPFTLGDKYGNTLSPMLNGGKRKKARKNTRKLNTRKLNTRKLNKNNKKSMRKNNTRRIKNHKTKKNNRVKKNK